MVEINQILSSVNMGNTAKAGSNMWLWIIGLFVLALLGLIFYMIYNYKKHNMRIKVTEILGDGNFFITSDRGKQTSKDGADGIHLYKRSTMLTPPPSSALSITKNGLLYAELIHFVRAGKKYGYKWVIDTSKKHFSENDFKKNPDSNEWSVETSKYDQDKLILSAEERATMADRERRAWDRKRKGLAQYIPLIGMALFAIVLILLFAMWGKITEPSIKAIEQAALITEAQKVMQIEQTKTQELINSALSVLYNVSASELGVSQNINSNVPLDVLVAGGNK